MSQISGPNFGGPVSGNKVGELFIGTAIDLGGIRQGLQKAEAEVRAANARMPGLVVPVGNKSAAFGASVAGRSTIGAAGIGMGAGPGVSTIGGRAEIAAVGSELEGADRKARGLLGTLANIRRVMFRLAIPIAIAAAIIRIAEAWRRAREEVERFKRAQDEASATTINAINQRITLLRAEGSEQEALIRLEFERRGVVEQAQAGMRKHLEEMRENWLSLQNVIGAVLARLQGVDRIAEKFDAMNEAVDKVNKRFESLKKVTGEVNERLERQKRLMETLRNQRAFDITRGSFDAVRFGQASDILQRQRTGLA